MKTVLGTAAPRDVGTDIQSDSKYTFELIIFILPTLWNFFPRLQYSSIPRKEPNPEIKSNATKPLNEFLSSDTHILKLKRSDEKCSFQNNYQASAGVFKQGSEGLQTL